MTLIGYWPLNETEGDTAYDYSGNENHGGLEGSPTQGVNGIIGGSAYDFDGGNDFVDGGDIDLINGSKELTMSAWVYQNNTDSRQAIIGKGANSNEVFNLYVTDGGGYQLQVRDSDNNYDSLTVTPPSSQVGEWVLVTGVWKRGEMLIYYNGELLGSKTHSDGDTTVSNEFRFMIGEKDDTDDPTRGWFFDGKICEGRVWHRALTASEVQYLYNVGRRGRFVSRKKQP